MPSSEPKEKVMDESEQRGPDVLLEAAWGIIANAGHGDWSKESADWQEAATRWRDRYHLWLDPTSGTRTAAAG